jgi:4-hydroxybenzoate polyprenyltransferase and related prenyltransferases
MKTKIIQLFSSIESYLRMIKFSHTIFALPFAGIALVEILYKYYFKNFILDWTLEELILKILGIILCMISMRSAAMGFNRIVDREYDAKNPRTSNREIPTGKISLKKAKIFVVYLQSSLFYLLFLSILWLVYYLLCSFDYFWIFLHKKNDVFMPFYIRFCHWSCTKRSMGSIAK